MLSHIIYYLPDIQKALAFYREAFGLETRFVHESGAYGELETGAVALAFASEELADSNLPAGYRGNRLGEQPSGNEITFTVEDVETAFKKALAAGATEVTPPAEKPWGQTVAYVRDPDGILIEIASSLR